MLHACLAIGLQCEDVGDSQFLEPRQALLLQMVFGDQGHGVKPESLPVVNGVALPLATCSAEKPDKPGMADPEKAFNTRSAAVQAVWGVGRRRCVAIKKASCP